MGAFAEGLLLTIHLRAIPCPNLIGRAGTQLRFHRVMSYSVTTPNCMSLLDFPTLYAVYFGSTGPLVMHFTRGGHGRTCSYRQFPGFSVTTERPSDSDLLNQRFESWEVGGLAHQLAWCVAVPLSSVRAALIHFEQDRLAVFLHCSYHVGWHSDMIDVNRQDWRTHIEIP